MKSGQRVIKYLAIALAIFIIISIVSAILLSFNIFSDFLGLTKGNDPDKKDTVISNSEKIEKYFENGQISSVKIELAYANLTIKEGQKFHVESNTRNIEYKQVGNQLTVKEKNINLFNANNQRNIIITVPSDTILDNAKIEAGAGEIKIEKLATNDLSLEIGAGKVNIQNLQVTKKAKIEGGAGKVEIADGSICNLDLDMGVGSFEVSTSLTGNNKIEAGIGKLVLTLKNGLDNYTIRASKGVGSIKIGEKEISNNVEYGTGETYLKVDGGIGSIEIK